VTRQQLCPQLTVSEIKNQFIIDKILSNTLSAKIEKMLIQALEHVEDGNYSDALKLYDLALREEPDNTSVLVDKGATLQNMGKLKLAIRCYDKVLNISPENLDALLNKGAALHSDQKYLEAIECYDIALKVDKKCAMALAYKGLSLGEMGKLQDAIKYFKKALSIDKHYDLANISKDVAQELLKSIKTKKSKTQ
jgi:tetratricopeptide (TPR) repeat protein